MIGAVCLLLWGARMVKNGFTRAYGTSLRRAIGLGNKSRILAFVAGFLTTSMVQSATAVIMMTGTFLQKNTMGLAAALAVVLGADLGTAVVARALALHMEFLSPLLLSAGVIVHMNFERSGRIRHLGRALIGLGLMLLSLGLMRHAAEPLSNSAVLPMILKPLEQEPGLAIVFSALFTWMLHSSLAGVLLFSAMAAHSAFSPALGLFLVMGANIGGALVALFLTYREGPEMRRLTMGNLFTRVLLVAGLYPFIGILAQAAETHGLHPGAQGLYFHVFFNAVLGVVFLPLTGVVARILIRVIPDPLRDEDPLAPLYLDPQALKTPVIALAAAARETLRMAEMVEKMLTHTISALRRPDEKIIEQIEDMDNAVDRLNQAIKIYLTRLSRESFDPKEADRYLQILTFATNLENCGDIIDKNLMELARKRMRTHESFSQEGLAEIVNFHAQVLENLKLAQTIFLSEDPALAAQLVEKKRIVRQAEVESSRQHFNRLRQGMAESIATSGLHLDIIRDLRRINSYITSVAYTIIDTQEKYRQKRKRTKISARMQTQDNPPAPQQN